MEHSPLAESTSNSPTHTMKQAHLPPKTYIKNKEFHYLACGGPNHHQIPSYPMKGQQTKRTCYHICPASRKQDAISPSWQETSPLVHKIRFKSYVHIPAEATNYLEGRKAQKKSHSPVWYDISHTSSHLLVWFHSPTIHPPHIAYECNEPSQATNQRTFMITPGR